MSLRFSAALALVFVAPHCLLAQAPNSIYAASGPNRTVQHSAPPVEMNHAVQPVPQPHVEPIEEAGEYVWGSLQADWANESNDCYVNWFNVDYQLSWLRTARTPALVTTSGSAVGLAQAGVLGLNSTSTLLGANPWSNGASSGFRLSGGQWLGCGFGVEIGGFMTEDRAGLFHVESDGSAGSFALGRPFIDTLTGKESAAVNSFAGAFAGSIDSAYRTQMWGSEINLVFREEPGRFFRTQLRAGLRYIDLDEAITIQESSTPLGARAIPFNGAVAVTNPDSVRVTDNFRTRNQFVGPQVGFNTGFCVGRLNFSADAKVAIGGTHQDIAINGTSETIGNGRSTNLVSGGLLANSANIGNYTRNAFSVVPEVEFKMEYRMTPTLSAFVSYDFLAWNDVALPGDQIRRNVDLTRVPTSALFGRAGGVTPTFNLSHGNFSEQSIHVGFTLKF